MVPETLHGDGDPPREGECYVWTGSPYPPEGLKTGFHNKNGRAPLKMMGRSMSVDCSWIGIRSRFGKLPGTAGYPASQQ